MEIGAGNISDVGTDASNRKDHDVVPTEAMVRTSMGDAHTGRGGAGNVDPAPEGHEKPSEEGEGHPMGLADKLKGRIFGAFNKK